MSATAPTRGDSGRGDHLQYLLTAYLFESLSPAGKKEVEEHLAACPACRAELEELRATLGLVTAALAPSPAPDDSVPAGESYSFEARRLQRVLEAARKDHGLFFWLRSHKNLVGLAAAAALLLVGLLPLLGPLALRARRLGIGHAPGGGPGGAPGELAYFADGAQPSASERDLKENLGENFRRSGAAAAPAEVKLKQVQDSRDYAGKPPGAADTGPENREVAPEGKLAAGTELAVGERQVAATKAYAVPAPAAPPAPAAAGEEAPHGGTEPLVAGGKPGAAPPTDAPALAPAERPAAVAAAPSGPASRPVPRRPARREIVAQSAPQAPPEQSRTYSDALVTTNRSDDSVEVEVAFETTAQPSQNRASAQGVAVEQTRGANALGRAVRSRGQESAAAVDPGTNFGIPAQKPEATVEKGDQPTPRASSTQFFRQGSPVAPGAFGGVAGVGGFAGGQGQGSTRQIALGGRTGGGDPALAAGDAVSLQARDEYVQTADPGSVSATSGKPNADAAPAGEPSSLPAVRELAAKLPQEAPAEGARAKGKSGDVTSRDSRLKAQEPTPGLNSPAEPVQELSKVLAAKDDNFAVSPSEGQFQWSSRGFEEARRKSEAPVSRFQLGTDAERWDESDRTRLGYGVAQQNEQEIRARNWSFDANALDAGAATGLGTSFLKRPVPSEPSGTTPESRTGATLGDLQQDFTQDFERAQQPVQEHGFLFSNGAFMVDGFQGKSALEPLAALKLRGEIESRYRSYKYYRELDPNVEPEVFFRKIVRVPPPEVGDEGLGEAGFRARYGVNPFVDTTRDHLSTFALDVDTASFNLAKGMIQSGKLPGPKTVRVEEFVNAFRDEVAADPSQVFTVACEGGPSPFGQGLELLKVTVKARELLPNERKNAVLTFAVDASGSMALEGRLDLARAALESLTSALLPDDRVAIVAFGASPYLVLPHTRASERERLTGAIRSIAPTGGTNVEAGLDLAYRVADEVLDQKGMNRVILCSDGVANVGARGPDEILRKVEVYARRGIYLSAVGFGRGKYNDNMLETLANRGNGNYSYVDSAATAAEIFQKNLPSTLQVLAQDAKLQVDLDPEVVSHYRLLGYENRDVADKDFRNDKVDAGEVGPGTTVTALYELRRRPSSSGSLGRVNVRYRDTGTGRVDELTFPIPPGVLATELRGTSDRFRFVAATAETAELLKQSYWARDGSFAGVLEVLEGLSPEFKARPEWKEIFDLADRAQRLVVGR